MTAQPISDKMMELIAHRFRILGEPYRLRILQLLACGAKTVGELVTQLEGNQPNVSKHLQMLHQSGLVSRRRVGTSVHYAISDPMVFKLCELVCRTETQKIKLRFYELGGRPGLKAKR